MNIEFRKFKDEENEYKLIHKWCQNKNVYEYFEQRILSLEEITNKYKNKLNKQELLIIQCDNKDIGLVQIYKYDDNINIGQFNNPYEYDLYIGEEEYLNKGVGTLVVNKVKDMIYSKYNADALVLRPFKKNIRAIKCYQKCGFEITNEYDGTDSLSNKETICVLLNKKSTIE